jgi:hypothetical protein
MLPTDTLYITPCFYHRKSSRFIDRNFRYYDDKSLKFTHPDCTKQIEACQQEVLIYLLHTQA